MNAPYPTGLFKKTASWACAALLWACFTPALAGPFAELGVGTTVFGSCFYDGSIDLTLNAQGLRYEPGCGTALGIASVGYRVNGTGLTIQYEHFSDLRSKDPGLDVLSIRYRWELKEK